MRLQHLHLLLTLAKTGSLRASAQILNVSQPALTKALRQLEDEFGTVLVVRTPKGVRLAPAGELLAARAATVVREIDRAREEVAWHLRHAEAQVTVGVSPVAAILLAPGAVERFGARWPLVSLRMRDALYPRALEQVRAGELDMALGPLPLEGVGRDLVVQPLFDSQSVLVARRSHPLARAKKLVELLDSGWVLTGPAGGPGDPRNIHFSATGDRTPQVRLECESFATLLALMPRLDVIGIMPKGFFDRYGPVMDLVKLPIADVLPHATIHVLHRADTPLTLPAQRLLEAFLAEAHALRASLHR
jgi:DNA-binding transcriptional LysR family regulator